MLVVDGRNVHLGRWDTLDEAEVAADRAALHFGVTRELRHPGRARSLGPASPEELRAIARERYKARTATSRFFGVSWATKRRRWCALVRIGRKTHNLGFYDDEREAAVMVDAVCKYLGLPVRNFPELPTAATSPAELRRRRRRARAATLTSEYIGVVYTEPSLTRPWAFYLKSGDEHTSCGGYATEREAAIARDRAAPHYQEEPALNFPRHARSRGPADLTTLRAEVFVERKRSTSSQYRGVSYVESRKSWVAGIVVHGRRIRLGYFDDEVTAACAYDDAAVTNGFPERANFKADQPGSVARRRRRA